MTYDYKKLQNGSDIRGVALEGVSGEPVNLTPEAVERLAKGFLVWLKNDTGKAPSDLTITVGRDSRLSGEAITEGFVAALKGYGCRIIDCGMASTPAMFMSTVFPEFDADGAVMITASHLPWNRNGMKFFSKRGGLDKGDITDIIVFAESSQILGQLMPCGQAPETEAPALMDVYSAHLRKLITEGTGSEQPLAGLKICVDAGNGAGGFYASKVLAPLGADVSTSQFLEPDGHFPNHAPNPENKEAMASICQAVKAGGCDLGLIFDTDVDRSSAVDENGCEISRNGIVAMAAALIADKYPGTTVVTDSVTSDELHDYLEGKLGLKHLRFKRGYRNVINKSVELNSEGIDSQLAIETSGHAAYGDNYFLDDGAFLATRIVIRTALLAKEGKKISSVIADLAQPAESVEVRLPITAEDFGACADAALAAVEKLAETGSPKAEGVEFTIVSPNYEGIRIAYSGAHEGWFLARKSLHDPIIPINIESRKTGGCDVIRCVLADCLGGIEGLDISKLK